MKVRMIVDFQDYKKGTTQTVSASEGAKLIRVFEVATEVKSQKKKIDAAPVDKQVKGAALTK